MSKCGKLVVLAPKELSVLDSEIIRYMAEEIKATVGDSMCDFVEYGSGEMYDVGVMIVIERKDGK